MHAKGPTSRATYLKFRSAIVLVVAIAVVAVRCQPGGELSFWPSEIR